MRKLLFALVVMTMGFAFGGGAPASAMTAGAVTGMNDLVKAGTQAVHYRYYRHHHRWWGWRRYHRRNCWWRHGRRYCRY